MRPFPPLLARLLQVQPYEVELLHPRQRIVPLAWGLLAAGALALCGATLACRPALSQNEALGAEQQRLQAAMARLDAAGAGGRHGRTGGSAGERDALAEAGIIVGEAHRPWHELFDQLEAAAKAEGNGVHLVQLNIEPSFSNLQLVTEGRDLDKLVRFAQHLAGNGPVRSMALTHHEWRDTLGAHVVTASLRGDLDGGTVVADAAAPAGAKP